jgi:hypothetical protein
MKRLCLLTLVSVVTMVGVGCAPSAHDRYRQMTWRYDCQADGISIQDDADSWILKDRPTHLSQWYFE